MISRSDVERQGGAVVDGVSSGVDITAVDVDRPSLNRAVATLASARRTAPGSLSTDGRRTKAEH